MKSTGFVRKGDELGRIVIPIELRRSLETEIKDPVEIFVEDDKIVFKKYSPIESCVFCGESIDTIHFHGKYICGNCTEKIDEVAKSTDLVNIG